MSFSSFAEHSPPVGILPDLDTSCRADTKKKSNHQDQVVPIVVAFPMNGCNTHKRDTKVVENQNIWWHYSSTLEIPFFTGFLWYFNFQSGHIFGHVASWPHLILMYVPQEKGDIQLTQISRMTRACRAMRHN